MKKPNLTFDSRYHQGIFTPKNPHKYVGDVTAIIYRSGLEKRFLKYFDESLHIVEYASEEIIIPYVSPADGRPHRYFPDFWIKVRTADGSLEKFIIEIKPASQCKRPKKGRKQTKTFVNEMLTFEVNKAKWLHAEEYCAKNGMKFQVLTEEDIKIR